MKKNLYLLCFLLTLLSLSDAHGQAYLNDYILKLSAVAEAESYGYTEKNPVKVGGMASGASNELAFLNALRGPNGEKVRYERLGSCCSFKTKNALIGKTGLLDRYELRYPGIEQPVILYINAYDYEDPQCPQGFSFFTAETLPKLKTFPADSIKTVRPCDPEQRFAVRQSLLNAQLGAGYKEPDQLPNYPGGLENLKSYFQAHPLSDQRAQGSVFRVAISFRVNCEGKAGDFKIITKGKGDLEELAHQVLAVVNEMPEDWEAAQEDDRAVDCYQVLSFTVFGGALDRVSYKFED